MKLHNPRHLEKDHQVIIIVKCRKGTLESFYHNLIFFATAKECFTKSSLSIGAICSKGLCSHFFWVIVLLLKAVCKKWKNVFQRSHIFVIIYEQDVDFENIFIRFFNARLIQVLFKWESNLYAQIEQ